jgi:exodeoxyribonuclease VII small subunit
MSTNTESVSFEAAVSRLEEIVTALEAGTLPLEECLEHFEQAVRLSRLCAARLDAAEQQIQVLAGPADVRPAADSGWFPGQPAGEA